VAVSSGFTLEQEGDGSREVSGGGMPTHAFRRGSDRQQKGRLVAADFF